MSEEHGCSGQPSCLLSPCPALAQATVSLKAPEAQAPGSKGPRRYKIALALPPFPGYSTPWLSSPRLCGQLKPQYSEKLSWMGATGAGLGTLEGLSW